MSPWLWECQWRGQVRASAGVCLCRVISGDVKLEPATCYPSVPGSLSPSSSGGFSPSVLRLSSKCRSCCKNPEFGPMSRFRRTAVMASARDRPWHIIRYARTSAPERLTPMAQCTNTFPGEYINNVLIRVQYYLSFALWLQFFTANGHDGINDRKITLENCRSMSQSSNPGTQMNKSGTDLTTDIISSPLSSPLLCVAVW